MRFNFSEFIGVIEINISNFREAMTFLSPQVAEANVCVRLCVSSDPFFFNLFVILNFGHAQRRRLRRVLGFVCYLEFVICIFSPIRRLYEPEAGLSGLGNYIHYVG